MKILNRQDVYSGRAFDVQRVHLQLPNGQPATYDLVLHPDSVSIVPLTSGGDLLFVRQYRIGAGKALLELPAGVMEPGENPQDCAARELREETGMAAAQLMLLGQAHLTPGYCTELMYFFFASQLYPAPLQADADEFLHLEAIPAPKALEMARRGQDFDSKTLAALFLAQPFLNA